MKLHDPEAGRTCSLGHLAYPSGPLDVKSGGSNLVPDLVGPVQIEVIFFGYAQKKIMHYVNAALTNRVDVR